MGIKKISFWLLPFAILLFSIILALFYIPPSSTNSISPITPRNIFQLSIFKRVLKQSGLENFLPLLSRLLSRRQHHHHRRHRLKCDKKTWKNRLISHFKMIIYRYRVSLILTVDSRGCASFTSVQKAVDAVPDFSPSRTLIIIDSGTYRLLSSHTTEFRDYFNNSCSVLLISFESKKMAGRKWQYMLARQT